jgi:hypothetical protein
MSAAIDPPPCSSPNNQVAVSLNGLDTSRLFFGIYCKSPPYDGLAATEHDAQAEMYSIAVTLSETGLPS